MIDVFWACLIGGTAFALVTLVGGGRHHGGLHRLHGFRHALRFRLLRFLHPTTVVGAVTAFGGAGIMLAHYTALGGVPLAATAAAVALLLSVAVHFGYVRPMEGAESSMAFSVADFRGRSGIVTIAIAATGHGEVMIRMGAGNTCRIAASFEGTAIERGCTVVVVDVRNGILLVSPADFN